MGAAGSPRSADPLVGRLPELATVAAAVDDGTAGRPTVVLISGDAGMGKTTLVHHALAQLSQGTQVQQVAADELASHVPFELAHRLGSTSTEPFAAGMQILENWSSRQDMGALVVVVEDLHWADTESTKALLTAVQRLDQDRVTVIVTTRPELHDGWARFRRDSQRCRTVTVGAFGADEVALVAGSAGLELTPYQAERLRAHTAGHPLYVRTLLSELSSEELRAADGELPAPKSLTSAVTARLSEIPEAGRSLAAALAVLNQRTPLPLLSRIAGVESPIGPFEELLGTGFVRWDTQEPGPPIEFTHPLYRQAVYDDLSPSRRRDLHRAASLFLGSGASLAHRVAAADGTNDVLAEDLEAEARRELEAGNKSAAARSFQWASSLSAERTDGERRLIDAACAYIDAGQTNRAAALRHDIEAFQDGPGRSLVLGLLEWDKGHTENALRWLESVVRPQPTNRPGDRNLVARAWAELAEIHLTLVQGTEAAHAAAQAMSLALPHTPAERLAHELGALAQGQLGGAASGLEMLRRRLPESPDRVRRDEVDMLVVRATLAWYAGLTTTALTDLRGVLALARRGFVPVLLARCHRLLASALMTVGEFDEAMVHARTALSIAADDRSGIEDASCHAVLGTILAYRGDKEASELHVVAAFESANRVGGLESLGLARIASAAVQLAQDNPHRVVESLDPLADVAPVFASLTFWPSLVTALIETGQLDRAATRIDELVAGAAERGLDMKARVLGLHARLEAARGQLERADTVFTSALAGFGPDDPFLERVLLLWAHGRVQLQRGAREVGVATLQQAQSQLSSVGAEPLAVRVAEDLKRAGTGSGRKSAGTSLALTDRERDVAVLVAKGYSNPEVASELYVSRKAIEYHLSNIYGKLGITSRRQLRGIEV